MNIMKNNQLQNTTSSEYTNRLLRKQMIWWKRILNVQAPYRWNLQRLRPGFTLDVGCGIGRNLINLDGQGIGIDHNLSSVEIAKEQGFVAFTPEEFLMSDFNLSGEFDSILLAHVAEHMTQEEVTELLRKYLPNLKLGGKLIIITPQEAGYKSDASHVQFMGFLELRNIVGQLDLKILREYSFPFPRFVGQFFLYNEFVSVSCKV
jgi:SAM-dependent methyltransferase